MRGDSLEEGEAGGERQKGRRARREEGLGEEGHDGHQRIQQHRNKPSCFQLGLCKNQTCQEGCGVRHRTEKVGRVTKD